MTLFHIDNPLHLQVKIPSWQLTNHSHQVRNTSFLFLFYFFFYLLTWSLIGQDFYNKEHLARTLPHWIWPSRIYLKSRPSQKKQTEPYYLIKKPPFHLPKSHNRLELDNSRDNLTERYHIPILLTLFFNLWVISRQNSYNGTYSQFSAVITYYLITPTHIYPGLFKVGLA